MDNSERYILEKMEERFNRMEERYDLRFDKIDNKLNALGSKVILITSTITTGISSGIYAALKKMGVL